MNRASCKGPWKLGGAAKFPFAPFCAKKENIHSPKRRATLMLRKEYATILTVGIPFRAALSNSITDRLDGERSFAYRLGFYSRSEDR